MKTSPSQALHFLFLGLTPAHLRPLFPACTGQTLKSHSVTQKGKDHLIVNLGLEQLWTVQALGHDASWGEGEGAGIKSIYLGREPLEGKSAENVS